MLGVIELNDLVAASFGHSLNERIVCGLREFPELEDGRLVGEVKRLKDLVGHFESIETSGLIRWDGIYIKVPREDLVALRSLYPDDEEEDLLGLIQGEYSAPHYHLEFSLHLDGSLFSIRSESPYFSIILDLSKNAFLVPPKVISHDRSDRYKRLTGEVVSALQTSLEEALSDNAGYRKKIEQELAYEKRIGRVKSSDLVDAGVLRPTSLTAEQVEMFLKIAPKLGQRHPLSLSLDDYLRAVQIALSSIDKAKLGEPLKDSYLASADGRDGGMLDLPPNSVDDFHNWFSAAAWHGAHPFEIVRGFHNHTAIRLYVTPSEEKGRLELLLCGSWSGGGESVVRMALALDSAGISFTLSDLELHKARLRGDDWLLVSESSGFAGEDWQDVEFDDFKGTVSGQISYWELAEKSEALKLVAWNAPVIIKPL